MGNKRTLAVYTYSHFAVDFACFFLLLGNFVPNAPSATVAAAGFLLYNIIAFGLQPVLGALCDSPRFPRFTGRLAAPLGVGLVLLGLTFWVYDWPALVLAALGNALFHVGGGIDSLAGAEGKMARSGVFVSSGALGVALGTLAGGNLYVWHWVALPYVLLGFALLFTLPSILGRLATPGGLGQLMPRRAASKHPRLSSKAVAVAVRTVFRGSVEFSGIAAPLAGGAVIALAMVSIMVRGWAGGLVLQPWKTTALLGLVPGVAACIGKAAGGFLADRFGPRVIGVASLLLSAPLLCLWYASPWAFAAGTALFNVNMAITLCAIAEKLPHSPGLAFGLTTLGLLCGTTPLFFFRLPALAQPFAVAAAILVSAGCLFFALAGGRRPGPGKSLDSTPESTEESEAGL